MGNPENKFARKEEIDLCKYNWKQIESTQKEINKLLIKKVYPTLTLKQIEECRIDDQMELENLYDKLNQIQNDFSSD